MSLNGESTSHISKARSGDAQASERHSADWPLLLGATISLALIVAFAVFKVDFGVTVLKGMVVALSSVIFVGVYWLSKMRRPLSSVDVELTDGSRFGGKILKTLPVDSDVSLEESSMPAHHSLALVRTFAIGIAAAALGLGVNIGGLFLGNFSLRYTGAGLLVVGLSAVTFSLLRAEYVDEQQRVP